MLDRRAFLVAAGALTGGRVAGTASATQPADSQRSTAPDSEHQSGTADSYEPLGSVDVPGARDAAVAGDVAYVAASDGFAVVDVADPQEPAILAERREIETDTSQQLLGIWDVWPWADRLVVAGPAQFSPTRPTGVALFDVSDPATPEQVAFHPTDDYIHNLHVADGVVYLTGRDDGMSVVMVDIGDDDPAEVGRWSPLDTDERWADVEPPLRLLHDVYVQDGMAYLPYWDAGTWLVDVSDPTAPVARGRVADYTFAELAAVPPEQANLVARTPRGAHHYAQVDETGSMLAVGRETWAVDDDRGVVGEAGRRVGGASGIDLYDVSDPTAPEHRASIDPPESVDQRIDRWFTTAHNFDIQGERLYSSWYFGGVAVYDVSDPASPVELARWRQPREASFWTAQAVEASVQASEGGTQGETGDAFVASSADLSTVFGGLSETREALYLFPDRAGSQADPPSLTDWPEDLFGSEPDHPPVDWAGASVSRVVDVGGQDGNQSNGTDTDSGAGDPNGTNTSEADDTETDDADGDGPGMGLAAALAGLGGYLLARRTGRLSDSAGE